MNHEITWRALTSEEASLLKRRIRTGIKGLADEVVAFVFSAGGVTIAGMVVAVAAGWVANKLGFGGFRRPVAIAVLTVFALSGVAAGTVAIRQFRRIRQHARMDIKDAKVQVIQVENARLVEREEFNDEGPLYYFGIGQDKVLFLGGQWLYDWEVYGVSTEPSFPSASFTVHRLPSGPVLRIELKGVRLAPEAVLPRKAPLPDWADEPFKKGFLGESILLEGGFEELRRRAEFK